jgi:predicted branched-subunit amino acid permease
VLAVWLVNLRHMLYSASLAPYVAHLPMRWRAGIAYLLTDEAYAVSITNYRDGPQPHGHWYVLGAGVALWVCWQVTSVLGVALGTAVPESWELEFALPLTFIALLVPVLNDRPSVAAAVVAAAIAVAGFDWGYSAGLFAAALAGMAAGLALERALGRPPAETESAA